MRARKAKAGELRYAYVEDIGTNGFPKTTFEANGAVRHTCLRADSLPHVEDAKSTQAVVISTAKTAKSTWIIFTQSTQQIATKVAWGQIGE